MQPDMNMEKLLQNAIDGIFDIDRVISEAIKDQKKVHLAVARSAQPSEDLLKEAKDIDDVVDQMKAKRSFLANILFQTTGAFVVPIWYE